MEVVVVLSGGMDSAVALALAVENFGKTNVETLTFNYGSKHNAREHVSARALCEHYGVRNTLVNLDFIAKDFKSNLLIGGGEIPEGHYADESMKKTVVPFRNGIMLSIAIGYAESIDADQVHIGNHAGDHAIYPDCRTPFINAMKDAARTGTYKKIDICSPFGSMTKAQIANIGNNLNVPFGLTWSCYRGEDIHCGKCGTCFERIEAFKLAKITDLTEYRDAN